jgi:hypothetical protein
MFRRSALGDRKNGSMKSSTDRRFDFLLRLSLAGRIDYCPEPLTKWRLTLGLVAEKMRAFCFPRKKNACGIHEGYTPGLKMSMRKR